MSTSTEQPKPYRSGNGPNTLRLSQKVLTADSGTPVEIDSLELLLPCRSYDIRYKISEAGQHTLTSEFVLRLLRVAGAMPQELVATYFGFDDREAAFAIEQAEQRGLVARSDGRVVLTSAGLEAFAVGGEKPELYEVHPRQGRFDFDEIAFMPARPRHLERLALTFAELGISDEERLGSASKEARAAFQANFRECTIGRGGPESERKALYTVDDVRAERRRYEVIPVSVTVSREAPNRAVPKVDEWKSGNDLHGRDAILTSISNLFARAEIQKSDTPEDAYKTLCLLAPEPAGQFLKAGVFDRGGFMKLALDRTGAIQANRRTVPLLGAVYTNANVLRLGGAAQLLLREGALGSRLVFWLKPSLPLWGSTGALSELPLSLLWAMEGDVDGESGAAKPSVVGIGDNGSNQVRCKRAFSEFVSLPPGAWPPDGLEILLFPNRLAVVMVHGAIGSGNGYPVALGVASVASEVVGRTQAFVRSLLQKCSPSQVGSSQVTFETIMHELQAPSIEGGTAP